VPDEFANVAGAQQPAGAQPGAAGHAAHGAVQPSTLFVYFGMEHPVVGGYEPAQGGAARAIALSYDVRREIDLVRKGQAVPAAASLPPGVTGYDPASGPT
jgi:hypothetical protein